MVYVDDSDDETVCSEATYQPQFHLGSANEQPEVQKKSFRSPIGSVPDLCNNHNEFKKMSLSAKKSAP